MLRSVFTTLHPAISLVSEYISTSARTPGPVTSMRWSSPTKPGVLVTETRVSSGPALASEVATATFTFVGNSPIASRAVPEKTCFFSRQTYSHPAAHAPSPAPRCLPACRIRPWQAASFPDSSCFLPRFRRQTAPWCPAGQSRAALQRRLRRGEPSDFSRGTFF